LLVAGRPELQEFEEPPAVLREDGRELWRTEVRRLVEVGMIDRVDRPMLVQLCVQYDRICQAQRVLAKYGHYTRGSVGQLREHPALKIEREATVLFHRIAQDFAMTPTARTKLGLQELHARSIKAEMESALGPVDLRPLVEDDAIDGTAEAA